MKKFKFVFGAMLFLFILFLAGCEKGTSSDVSSDNIPPHLVGVWTTENPRFQDGTHILLNGFAVYLNSDGTGAVWAGEPSVGWIINAKYKPGNKTIIYESIIEDEGISGKMKYDSRRETLTLYGAIKDGEILLKRRFEKIDEDTWKAFMGED